MFPLGIFSQTSYEWKRIRLEFIASICTARVTNGEEWGTGVHCTPPPPPSKKKKKTLKNCLVSWYQRTIDDVRDKMYEFFACQFSEFTSKSSTRTRWELISCIDPHEVIQDPHLQVNRANIFEFLGEFSLKKSILDGHEWRAWWLLEISEEIKRIMSVLNLKNDQKVTTIGDHSQYFLSFLFFSLST